VYNEKLKRNIQKVIDHNGKALIDSNYTSIYFRDNVYEVSSLGDDGRTLSGIFDKDCNELLPCRYEIPFWGIFAKVEMFAFIENKRCGLRMFSDNVVIPPEFDSISIYGDLITASNGLDKTYYKITRH
jgi:hypothetical protein